MKIAFCGDIMPGGVLPYQEEYVSNEILNVLNSADFRVGTLECAIGDTFPFDKEKMGPKGWKNIVYAHEKDFDRIKELKFDLVTLANNHIFDLGYDGLRNTIKLLKESGICYCGAGNNKREASRPCVVNIDDKKYAFIGCCFRGLPPWSVEEATESRPGIFLTDGDEICALIEKTKRSVDYVIILPHWGTEYDYMPPKKCYELAKRMVESGADAIIGSHTHIMNPRMTYKKRPIYFSLGNFLFPDFCLQVPRPIVYPETVDEVYNMPIVYNYPRSISEPTRVVWREPSRIGIIALLGFDNGKEIENKYHLTLLNDRNILHLLKSSKCIKEQMRLGLMGNSFISQLYYFAKRALNSRYNIFRRR